MSGYSEPVDVEALQYATKALLIIFIIVITISNGALVIKIMRRKHFLYSPKYLLLISLAVGDIFLALFALVIQAKIMFQMHELGLDGCRIGMYSNVYENYLLNFVYGIGLVVLSAELVYRRRSNRPRTTTHFDLIHSFLISSVPWFLGLIIVLPLAMAGQDPDMCRLSFTLERTNAQIVVSMVLPACLALVTAVVVVCFKMDRGYVQHLEMTSGDQTLASGQGTDGIVAQHRQQDALNLPPYNANQPYYPPQNPPYYPPQNPTNYPPHNPPYPPQGCYPHQGYINNSTNVNNLTVVVNDNVPTIPSTNAIYPEQNKILSLALIFFFLVTPLAVYYLVSLNGTMTSSALTNIVFGQGLMWLMLLRPFVTAVVTSQTAYLTQM
ncbi:uncharacterized protein LOC131956436 isoform X1 [Physella acuta]|uniref:uncharacterized protein LOC131956436 isoform X1 n=1 Tax=Physella acuta TaxID=109671 RepID=UPI0027DC5F4A|nr:uncharacterized protein LOC131956436 isoform X1 [Physella acuta]